MAQKPISPVHPSKILDEPRIGYVEENGSLMRPRVEKKPPPPPPPELVKVQPAHHAWSSKILDERRIGFVEEHGTGKKRKDRKRSVNVAGER